MSSSLKRFTFSLLARPSVLRSSLRQSDTIILMFHGFRDQANQGIENHDGKHLLGTSFDAFLSKLGQAVSFISLKKFVEHLEQGTPIPKPSVILTFDDGYESNYQVAFPILHRHQAPATIFLTTEFVTEGKPLWTNRLEYCFEHTKQTALNFNDQDFPLQSQSERIASLQALKKIFKSLPQEDQDKRTAKIECALKCALNEDPQAIPAIYRPLTNKQIRKMAVSGLVDFGAHTHSHRILGRCDEASIQQEIRASQKKVAELTNQVCDLFCYPNGQPGDFNDLTRLLLQQNGFHCALTTVSGKSNSACDPFTLRRFGVSDREPINWSLLEVSGILNKFRSLRGR